MATVTFSTNPVAEARAIVSALSLWLTEQPRPEQAPPAKAHYSYDDDGNLKSFVVTLEQD
ncbi:hypothetical protein D9M71_746320 [compost metagenome]